MNLKMIVICTAWWCRWTESRTVSCKYKRRIRGIY